MFSKMTVAKRLALGFSLIIIIGVAMVSYAAYSLHRMRGDIEELSSNRMVKVAQFSEVRDNLQTAARRVRNVIIIDDDQALYAEEVKGIQEVRARNTALLEQLNKTVLLPRGVELLATIKKLRDQYNVQLDRVLQHALKNENAPASDILFKEVLPLQTALFQAVDASRALQQDRADKIAADAREVASSGVMLMIGLAVLMAALGAAVASLMVRNLRRALGAEPDELGAVVARVAQGDLSQPLSVRPGDTGSVMARMAHMQQGLGDVVANVRANAESVATASTQISQGNHDLSQRTEEQASALEQTAATMEELNTTVRNNADSARQANQLAQGASEVAARGGQMVGKVVETMQGISGSSRKIGDIIGVIDGIAFQTNILALNAAVEAARAGEQGRGFAVVAGEVRTLAQRSAEAAKEIKTLIGRSVEQVEQGTHLVDEAGKTMGEIVSSIQRVSDIVAEITAAAAEQSSGIAQVGNAVSQMDQVTQQNAALVEESAAAAESLKGQAAQLVQAVASFKLARQAQAAGVTAPAPQVARSAPPVSPAAATAARTPVPAPRTTTPATPASAAAPALAGDDAWAAF